MQRDKMTTTEELLCRIEKGSTLDPEFQRCIGYNLKKTHQFIGRYKNKGLSFLFLFLPGSPYIGYTGVKLSADYSGLMPHRLRFSREKKYCSL